MKKSWFSIFVLSLFSAPFVWGQVGRGTVSSGRSDGMEVDSTPIRRSVELTTDGVKALMMRGDSVEAYKLFKQAIESDSTYAPANYAIADLLLATAPDTAVRFSRSAYLSDTTNNWYLDRYAQSVLSSGDYLLARELYEQLLDMSPADLNAYRLLSILYQHEGRVNDAIALLDSAELKVGQNPYLLSLKRQMLLSSNQVDRAIEEAQALVDESPYDADYRVILAELYAQNGDDTEAVAQYSKAVEIDPNRVQTLASLCNYYKQRGLEHQYLEVLNSMVLNDNLDVRVKVGMVKDALGNRDLFKREFSSLSTILTSLVIKHPNVREVVELNAQYLISIGMVERASEMLKGHLDDEPSQVVYYRGVVELEMFLKNIDSAILYQQRAIDRFPDEPNLKLEMGYMYAAGGRYDEAIDHYKQNLQGASDSLQSSIWGTVGDLLHRKIEDGRSVDSVGYYTPKVVRKRMREVYASYDKALKLFYDNALVLNNYAYFLAENGGDLDDALTMSERAVALEDGNPTYLDTHGWVMYRLGRYDEAKVVLRRAVTLDSTKNFEIVLHYGELLSALGEDTMAEFYWKRAIDMGATPEMVELSRDRVAKIMESDSKK